MAAEAKLTPKSSLPKKGPTKSIRSGKVDSVKFADAGADDFMVTSSTSNAKTDRSRPTSKRDGAHRIQNNASKMRKAVKKVFAFNLKKEDATKNGAEDTVKVATVQLKNQEPDTPAQGPATTSDIPAPTCEVPTHREVQVHQQSGTTFPLNNKFETTSERFQADEFSAELQGAVILKRFFSQHRFRTFSDSRPDRRTVRPHRGTMVKDFTNLCVVPFVEDYHDDGISASEDSIEPEVTEVMGEEKAMGEEFSSMMAERATRAERISIGSNSPLKLRRRRSIGGVHRPVPYARSHVYTEDDMAPGWPDSNREHGNWGPPSHAELEQLRSFLPKFSLDPEVPVDKQEKVQLVITGLSGVKLVEEDRLKTSHMYCRCDSKVLGLKFATAAKLVDIDRINWEYCQILPTESPPDMEFQVWRKGEKEDSLFGAAIFPSAFFVGQKSDEFKGELRVVNVSRQTVGRLRIEVRQITSERRAAWALEILKSYSFLQSLSEAQSLALLKRIEYVDVQAGEYFFYQGGPVDYMYVVVSGSVRLELRKEIWGKHPVTLSTAYDGHTYGDRIAESRHLSAVSQEPSFVIRVLQTEYRNAFAYGISEKTCEESDQKLMNSGMRLRIDGLIASPLFQGAGVPRLIQMASNLVEIELRQGDEFVRIGQQIDSCYLVLEGFVKVYVPAEKHEVNEHVAELVPCTEKPICTFRGKLAALLMNDAIPGHDAAPAEVLTAETAKARKTAPWIPCVKRTQRPPLQVSSGALLARQRGEPKPDSPWEDTLRHKKFKKYPVAPPSGDLDFGWLHQGSAFGFSILREESAAEKYESKMAIRVESHTCRLLVVTSRCLWYLPDSVVKSMKVALSTMEDPLKIPKERIEDARRSRQQWAKEKIKIIASEMLTAR